MIRGGDTPKQETLWAIEFESGKFAFGHANENQIFVATSGIDSQIWYADGNGIIAGFTVNEKAITDTLIATYNEHFGTKISHLTPEAKTFKVGDIIKNWNAYEKIKLTSQKIAIKFGESEQTYYFIVGTLSGENFEIITNGSGSCIVADNGIIDSYVGPPPSSSNYIKEVLQRVGITATSITEEIVSWKVGSSIPNWSEYTQYK